MRYLSRIRLKREASVSALAPLLLGKSGGGGQTRQPGHHLVWSLFADGTERKRDFLWRETRPGEFLVLSARHPEDLHGLFEIDEPKAFAPALEPGDRLRFSLRANPVVRRRSPSNRRSIKHDVVMDALRSQARGERAAHRFLAMQEQGLAWLTRQGLKSGFEVRSADIVVDGYDQHRLSRAGSVAPMLYSTLDFGGVLTVSDPAALVPAIAHGFGGAKAYGCGLMLIRRA